ncbi:MAG: DMT family transporter [Kiritimatiellae bacterium]|nr:DMT family transporter [Kiritimatiellia bacterium]MBR4252066.1 DMT family transporter [Kiritimatiellia bacterium]
MNRLQANICLLCVTLCWSAEIILFACIPAGVPAFATTCATTFAGSALLAVSFRRRVAAALRSGGWKFPASALLLAALSTSYNTLFLVGVKSFDVASGAFTFCMTVVVLPVVLLSLRRRVAPATWISVVLVLAGICLALGPALRRTHLPGLAIMAVGCLLRAVQIVLLADLVKKHDPIAVAVLVQGFSSVLALGGWAIQDPRLFAGLPVSRALVAAWALYAYFVVAFAQCLNVFAMRRVTAANATVVYSVEIVFSLLWGVFLPEGIVERVVLTPAVAIGALLVVAGSVAEIADFRGLRRAAEGGAP